MALAMMQPVARQYKAGQYKALQQSTTFVFSFLTRFTNRFVMKVILHQHPVTSGDLKPL